MLITLVSRTTDDSERSVEIKSSGSQRVHKTRHIERTVSFVDYYYLVGDINAKSLSRNAR